MRVLVVEDHPRLATALAEGLRREGMAIDLAFDGTEALSHVAVNRYDVVVLDRDLPGVHGDQVCRALVDQRSETRVLMLTAASTIRDRVEGLELGADDYLPKPFDFTELVARIRALARRAVPPVPPKLSSGGVTLDPARRSASRHGQPLDLSPKEFALLACLRLTLLYTGMFLGLGTALIVAIALFASAGTAIHADSVAVSAAPVPPAAHDPAGGVVAVPAVREHLLKGITSGVTLQ